MIEVNLNKDNSISSAIKALNDYKKWVKEKSDLLIKSLAEIGVNEAKLRFSGVQVDGDIKVSCVKIDNGYSVLANGEQVVFVEFGAGFTYGYGHPQTQMESGEDFSIGSWSKSPQGKGHWNDPEGWYYGHGKHTYGNAPAMAMYEAEQKILLADLTNIAKRVFK